MSSDVIDLVMVVGEVEKKKNEQKDRGPTLSNSICIHTSLTHSIPNAFLINKQTPSIFPKSRPLPTGGTSSPSVKSPSTSASSSALPPITPS